MAGFKTINEYILYGGSKLAGLEDTRSYNVSEIQALIVIGSGDKWFVKAIPVSGKEFLCDLDGTPFKTFEEAVIAKDILAEELNEVAVQAVTDYLKTLDLEGVVVQVSLDNGELVILINNAPVKSYDGEELKIGSE